ncbi:hypothetical protein GGI42DRAFT_309770 [Trichoderma sp. SZMC 28013]
MDSRYPRQDFSQLATPPSSDFKRAGSSSGWTSKPHKARGISEVSNRNTISKDSTQSNELWALELRNRATISKDLTQSDGPFKFEMQNRGATSKDKIGSEKANTTAIGPGGSPNPAPMGAMPPNASPGLYATHQPSPAQQRQQHQGQGPQQAHGNNSFRAQMEAHVRLAYNRLMGVAAAKFGGPEYIPQATVDKIKKQSYAQGQQSMRDLSQRRAQQRQQQAQAQAQA